MTARQHVGVPTGASGLSKKDRQTLQRRLEADRQRLSHEAGEAATELSVRVQDTRSEPAGDESDIGSYQGELGEGTSLAEHTATLLAATEHALRRLADGSYGRCEACQQPISADRLLALPRARLCMACQRNHER